MVKAMIKGAAAVLALASVPGAAQATMGPDAAACRNGQGRPAILVTVDGFKERTGNVRVALYGSNPRTSSSAARPCARSTCR